MINSEYFAERLEKIMSFYNISATTLAEKIQFNRSSISHLISGRNKPSLEFVLKILEIFPEVTWQWLTLGKGDFPVKAATSADIKREPVRQSKQNPDLFSQETEQPAGEKFTLNTEEIERIVVFYNNGKFKDYESL